MHSNVSCVADNFHPPPPPPKHTQAVLTGCSVIKTPCAHCQRETELQNIISTNSGSTYSRPGEFLFAAQHALIWQSAMHIPIRCCVVLCCAQTVAKVCVTTAIQFQYFPSPVSPTENTNRTLYMGLTHVSILVPQFLQTASCISSFVIRVSRIRISAVSQEAVN